MDLLIPEQDLSQIGLPSIYGDLPALPPVLSKRDRDEAEREKKKEKGANEEKKPPGKKDGGTEKKSRVQREKGGKEEGRGKVDSDEARKEKKRPEKRDGGTGNKSKEPPQKRSKEDSFEMAGIRVPESAPEKTAALDAGITAALAPHAARCYYIPETLGPRQPFVHPPSSAAECTLDAFVAECPQPADFAPDTPLPEPLSLPASALDHSAYGYPDFDAKAVAAEALYCDTGTRDGGTDSPVARQCLGGTLLELRTAGGDLPTVPRAHYFSRHRARHHEAARQLNVHRVVLQKNRMVLRIASYLQMPFVRAMQWARNASFHADTSVADGPPRPLRIHCADLYLPLPCYRPAVEGSRPVAINEYRQVDIGSLSKMPKDADAAHLQRSAAIVSLLPHESAFENAAVANQRAVVGLDEIPVAVRHSVLFSHGRRDVAYVPKDARFFPEFRAWAYVSMQVGDGDAATVVPALSLFLESFLPDVWPDIPSVLTTDDTGGCLRSSAGLGVSKRLVPVVLALQHMHARGFVHGCVTPVSVKCAASDRAWVLTNHVHTRRAGETTGYVHGTECYAPSAHLDGSPHVARPEDDVYMLAGLVYRVLTGLDPYTRTNVDAQTVFLAQEKRTLATVGHRRLAEIRAARLSGSLGVEPDWSMLCADADPGVIRLRDWASAVLRGARGRSDLADLLRLLVDNFGWPPKRRGFLIMPARKARLELSLVHGAADGSNRNTNLAKEDLTGLVEPRWPRGAPVDMDAKTKRRPKGVDGSDKELTKASEAHIVRMLGGIVPPRIPVTERFRQATLEVATAEDTTGATLVYESQDHTALPAAGGYILHGLAHEDDGADDLWCALRRLEMAEATLPRFRADLLRIV